MDWIPWVLVSPVLLFGLVTHLLTLAFGISMIRQCLRSRTYRRGSSLPLIGPLACVLAFVIVRSWLILWAAGLLLALEILLGVVTNIVMRRTGSQALPANDASLAP
jgi:hypothetical protein